MNLEILPAGGVVPGGEWEQECPFPFVLAPGGDEAEAVLEALGAEHPEATPVILGCVEDAMTLLEACTDEVDLSVNDILAKAATINPDAWLAERMEGLPAEEEWPEDAEPADGLASVRTIKGEPHTQVVIALLPITDATEVAALLKFGNFNSCPEPALHVDQGLETVEDLAATLLGAKVWWFWWD
jgi:hypothetical protein